MNSFFFGLLFLLAGSIANADGTWTNCRGRYSQTVNEQKYQNDFYISIPNDLSYDAIEFNYLFSDVDSGYLVPITKKIPISKNRIEIQVSYPNIAKPFASFEVVYFKNNIVSIENFVASEAQTGTTVGPMNLRCEM